MIRQVEATIRQKVPLGIAGINLNYSKWRKKSQIVVLQKRKNRYANDQSKRPDSQGSVDHQHLFRFFLVFALVGAIFFAPNPVLTFYMPVSSALLCGPVCLLMLAKV